MYGVLSGCLAFWLGEISCDLFGVIPGVSTFLVAGLAGAVAATMIEGGVVPLLARLGHALVRSR